MVFTFETPFVFARSRGSVNPPLMKKVSPENQVSFIHRLNSTPTAALSKGQMSTSPPVEYADCALHFSDEPTVPSALLYPTTVLLAAAAKNDADDATTLPSRPTNQPPAPTDTVSRRSRATSGRKTADDSRIPAQFLVQTPTPVHELTRGD